MGTDCVQTYTHTQMRQRILNACNHESDISKQSADALLLLSGSHPLRQLPWADRSDAPKSSWPVACDLTCCLACHYIILTDVHTEIVKADVLPPLISLASWHVC